MAEPATPRKMPYVRKMAPFATASIPICFRSEDERPGDRWTIRLLLLYCVKLWHRRDAKIAENELKFLLLSTQSSALSTFLCSASSAPLR